MYFRMFRLKKILIFQCNNFLTSVLHTEPLKKKKCVNLINRHQRKVLSIGLLSVCTGKAAHLCAVWQQCGSSCTVLLCHRTIRTPEESVSVCRYTACVANLSQVRITDHNSCGNILFCYLEYNLKQNYGALHWKIGKKQHIYYKYSHFNLKLFILWIMI